MRLGRGRLGMLVVLAVGLAGCAATPSGPVGPPGSGQALIFDATRVDLGKIQSTAGILSATFTATHRGSGTVEILRTEKDCGCLLSRPLPRRIEAGERLEVVLQVDPSGRSGRQSLLFSIETNEATPHYFLSIHADVELASGAGQPGIYLPSLVRGASEAVQVVVESASDVLGRAVFELSDPRLRIVETRVDGATLDLRLAPAADARAEKVSAVLTVRDAETGEARAALPVMVAIDDNVHFTRSTLFVMLSAGREAEEEVELRAHSGRLPRIGSVRMEGCSPEQARAELLSWDGARARIRVRIDPDALPGRQLRGASVVVELDDPLQPQATLPVFGVVRGS